MNKWVVVLLTVIGVLVLEAAVLLGVMWWGGYNISTYNHDVGIVNWFFDTGMERGVETHAKGITVPDLNDPKKVQGGFVHYDEMCVMCHGGPGVEPGEIGKGLWPKAPNLIQTVPEWTPQQLYWITKNGIKFSAMPAWGPTHNEEELWGMVAFLEKLPKISAEEYAAMKKMPGMKHHE
jgi:mono/diheme cytochrome c family protein